MYQLKMFGLNIWFLLGLLIWLAILLPLLFAGIILLMMWFKKRRDRREREAERRLHFDELGEQLPPMTKGICVRCGGAFQRVYYLPDRRKLCPECFQAEHGKE